MSALGLPPARKTLPLWNLSTTRSFNLKQLYKEQRNDAIGSDIPPLGSVVNFGQGDLCLLCHLIDALLKVFLVHNRFAQIGCVRKIPNEPVVWPLRDWTGHETVERDKTI